MRAACLLEGHVGCRRGAFADRLKVFRNQFDVSQGPLSETAEGSQSKRRVQLAQCRVFK